MLCRLRNRMCGRECIGLIWLIETAGELLWTRQWTFEFRHMRGFSWITSGSSAAKKWVCSMFVCLVGSKGKYLIEYMTCYCLTPIQSTVRYLPSPVTDRKFGLCGGKGSKTLVLYCECCAHYGVLEFTLWKMIARCRETSERHVLSWLETQDRRLNTVMEIDTYLDQCHVAPCWSGSS